MLYIDLAESCKEYPQISLLIKYTQICNASYDITDNPSVPAHIITCESMLFQRNTETEMSGKTYRQGVETTNEVMAGRSTAAVEHVTSWMISLHVRDRHLKGLTAVARQQPSPFLQLFFYFLTSVPSSQVWIVKEVGFRFYHLPILTHRLWTTHVNLQPIVLNFYLRLKTRACEADLDCFQVWMRSWYCEINRLCFGSVLPCAVQVDLTWVQLNILLLIKDAVDDGLQHLMQIQHPNSLTSKTTPYV